MKLQNNKTGEIVVFGEGIIDLQKIGCKNVHEMIEAGWEDYKEPIEFWTINLVNCETYHVIEKGEWRVFTDEHIKNLESIGFKFETEEESKKAIEKLKAWKRLKDKGFRFEGWDNTDRSTIHNFSLFVAIEDLESINKDLDLLFGE